MMDGLFPPRTLLGRVILVLVLFAIFIDVYAVLSGFNDPVLQGGGPDGYERFFQVPAWFPFPIYFILIYFVIRQSWDAFNEAWRTLPDTLVMQRCDGNPITNVNEIRNKIIGDFNQWRSRLLIPLSLLAGAACMWMDSERERDTMLATIYGYETDVNKIPRDTYDALKTTFSGQVARGCEDPYFMSKWLWDELAVLSIDATQMCALKQDPTTKNPISNTRKKKFEERMASVKEAVEEVRDKKDTYVEPPVWQWGPVLLMHIEDMFIISFAWLVFFQCVIHALFFWNFEHLPSAKENELCLKLNSNSPLNEFGLEHWNHALNNLYWYFSAALLIPISSRISQPNLEDLDFSQSVLQWAIPLLVATPMISTILARQSRIPACWNDLRTPEDNENYLSQRLWPLDKNWSSKLGVVLAFVILSISFGINLMTFI